MQVETHEFTKKTMAPQWPSDRSGQMPRGLVESAFISAYKEEEASVIFVLFGARRGLSSNFGRGVVIQTKVEAAGRWPGWGSRVAGLPTHPNHVHAEEINVILQKLQVYRSSFDLASLSSHLGLPLAERQQTILYNDGHHPHHSRLPHAGISPSSSSKIQPRHGAG